jgi:hypothetical protein
LTNSPIGLVTDTSLSDWLRHRTDDELADLLRRRPDLALPAPADFATLANRLGVRASVQRAVDGLNAAQLATLEALVLTRDSSQAAAILPGIDVAAALEELRATGLIWGEQHLVGAVADAVGPYPAGLGRPADQLLAAVSDVTLAAVLRTLGLPPASQPSSGAAVAAVLRDRERLHALLEECDPAERDVLDRLAGGPPVGVVRDALLPAVIDNGATPPHRLIAAGLLVPIDTQTVELPREVGLALRGGTPFPSITPTPPAVALVETDVDHRGTTAVLDTLRHVGALAELWSAAPPQVLRAGGLGVRDLRRAARELSVSEDVAALLVEIAAAAGLIAASHGIEPMFLPTSEYDAWRRREPAPRWVALANAWLGMTRQPSLIGQRDERDRLITPLGPDAERGTIPALRRQVLGVLADLPSGTAPAERADVLARLAWLTPRRASAQRRQAEAIFAEADILGVTAAGGLTSYGRSVLRGSPSAAETLNAALPEPVDHFLVQPDLTVVVPGPPTADLAEELSAVAELESTGGASVYRITDTSVRRGLDAGHTAAGISALFDAHSRTPVPQALRYLVDDVARRHGVLRAGTASAYLRCDDQALLSRVLADRATASLELRRIAPTVVVANAPVSRVLDVLREAGYAPAAEAPDGALVRLGADAPRAPSRPTSRLVRNRPATDPAAAAGELIRRLRAADKRAEIARRSVPPVPGVTSAATLGLLREAIRGGRRIWLGYVDAHGTSSQRTIEPISMAGGTLRGHDVDTGRLEAFALHHITRVDVLD